MDLYCKLINDSFKLMSSYPKPVAFFVPKLTGKAFGNNAGLFAKLASNWRDIVGSFVADRMKPAEMSYRSVKISGKSVKKAIVSFYVRDGATALEMQYQTDSIIEKMNRFVGYNAVHNVKFVQAPEMFQDLAEEDDLFAKQLSDNESEYIKKIVDDAIIEESELSLALKSLGESIFLDSK